MQEVMDMIYERSIHDCPRSYDLYGNVISRENILLAYRNIKTNTGSKTSGTDGQTIENIKCMEVEDFIEKVRNSLKDYQPGAVRRKFIAKESGEGVRPLGIPTMWDRLIQQMFKQVLEPIVEAKFHPHSYGFRPNRSTHHAIARCQCFTNAIQLHYVIDIDIKSFFDEVNHKKLIQQLYTIGIKDKRVLAIISKMLKAPIKGEGIPTKGTPQGGVLSTLLSNVVLNELDWWISSQWESFETRHTYTSQANKIGRLKKTNLKEMYIVRYADDVKVYTRNRNDAKKIFIAMNDFLEKRLHLKLSPEKSRITNLKRERSSFLGFELKAIKREKKYITRTYVARKRKKRIRKTLKEKIKVLQKQPTKENVDLYNATIMGIQNYFQYASNVSLDLRDIHYSLLSVLHNRLKINFTYGSPEQPSETYKNRYKNKYKTYRIIGLHLYPLADIQCKLNVGYNPKICNYTKEGREVTHKNIPKFIEVVIQEMNTEKETYNYNLEYYDNRISKYSMQRGKCAIMGTVLRSDEIYCHHKLAKHLNGDDRFSNLVIVHVEIGVLLQETNKDVIEQYLKKLSLNENQLIKVNYLRGKWNLPYINDND